MTMYEPTEGSERQDGVGRDETNCDIVIEVKMAKAHPRSVQCPSNVDNNNKHKNENNEHGVLTPNCQDNKFGCTKSRKECRDIRHMKARVIEKKGCRIKETISRCSEGSHVHTRATYALLRTEHLCHEGLQKLNRRTRLAAFTLIDGMVPSILLG